MLLISPSMMTYLPTSSLPFKILLRCCKKCAYLALTYEPPVTIQQNNNIFTWLLADSLFASYNKTRKTHKKKKRRMEWKGYTPVSSPPWLRFRFEVVYDKTKHGMWS